MLGTGGEGEEGKRLGGREGWLLKGDTRDPYSDRNVLYADHGDEPRNLHTIQLHIYTQMRTRKTGEI